MRCQAVNRAVFTTGALLRQYLHIRIEIIYLQVQRSSEIG